MARLLFPFSFLLFLSLLVAAASAFRTTTMTMVEVDVRQCSSSQMQMGSCAQFFTDEAAQIEMTKHWEETFPRCCGELGNINEQCRCQAINQVVNENVGVQELKEGPLKSQILSIARGLPAMCDSSSTQYCGNIQMQPQGQQQQQDEEEPSVF